MKTSIPQAASALMISEFDEAGVRSAAESCRRKLGGAPDLVFAFVTPDYESRLGEFIELVQVYAQSQRVAGCSGSGVIGDAAESEDVRGFSLLALRLPGTTITVSEIGEDGGGFPGIGEDGLAANPAPAVALIHPMRIDIESWLEEVSAATPEFVVTGGLAGGGPSVDQLFVFTETGVSDAAGVVVRFEGGVRVEALVSQGCRPIGRAERITEAAGNVVGRMGSDSAFAVLHEAVEGLRNEGISIRPGSIHAGLAVSEFIEDYRRGDFLVRNLLGADAVSGRVQVGAPVEPGRTLQFQFRDRDTADEDLRSQCAALRARTTRQPFAGLLFSCAGRGRHFFGLPDHDASVLADSFDRPAVAGFFCNGEIGPVGVGNYVHGYTASAALFYDAETADRIG